jgi:hypothetical protein
MNPAEVELIYILYKDSFRTLHKTQFAYIRKTNLSALYSEIMGVYCKS